MPRSSEWASQAHRGMGDAVGRGYTPGAFRTGFGGGRGGERGAGGGLEGPKPPTHVGFYTVGIPLGGEGIPPPGGGIPPSSPPHQGRQPSPAPPRMGQHWG